MELAFSLSQMCKPFYESPIQRVKILKEGAVARWRLGRDVLRNPSKNATWAAVSKGLTRVGQADILIIRCPLALQLQIVVDVVYYISRTSPLSFYSLTNVTITL
eukprot:186057-Pyramimonas_sp.AAC.1